MRKIILITMGILFLCSVNAHAKTNPFERAGRGAVNIVTSPVEIVKQARGYWIEGAKKTPHILVWIGSGAGWGFVQMLKRMGSGAYDIVSSPFYRGEEDKPLMKPDYVFQEWPKNPVSGR